MALNVPQWASTGLHSLRGFLDGVAIEACKFCSVSGLRSNCKFETRWKDGMFRVGPIVVLVLLGVTIHAPLDRAHDCKTSCLNPSS